MVHKCPHYNGTLEATSSNVLPGFTKPSVLRTANSMYKSNTSLDLDLEVSLVERAVSNVQIMNDGGIRLSNHLQNNVHQVPARNEGAPGGGAPHVRVVAVEQHPLLEQGGDRRREGGRARAVVV